MSDAPDISRPKIIGTSVKRTEDPRLLTGRGSFVDDRTAPDAPHVAFRRSRHAPPPPPREGERALYVGEAVVGVIAATRSVAEDALEAIAIDFEPLPHVADP